MEEATRPARDRSARAWLNLARAVLVLAVVLLLGAHFLPVKTLAWLEPGASGERGGQLAVHAVTWLDEWKRQWVPMRLTWDWEVFNGFRTVLIMIFGAILLVAMPFLAGSLSRAAALRWILRVLLIGLAVAGMLLVFSSKLSLGASGTCVFIAGLWLAVFGAFLIPRDGCECRMGWRKPLSVMLGCTVAGLFPWWRDDFRTVDAGWKYYGGGGATWRDDDCRCQIVAIKEAMGTFVESRGVIPTSEDMKKVLARDPWGRPYRYKAQTDNEPWVIKRVGISSDGADGEPGTADDLKIEGGEECEPSGGRR